MSVQLRNLGTTATFAPMIKRAVGRHSDGRTLIMTPDTNLATANGTNVSGTGNINVYASSDTARTAFSSVLVVTPAVAASSATKKFVGSMAVGTDASIWIAYQGTDNSLHLAYSSWSGTAYNTAVDQVVLAASAVTDRFRAIDLDVTGAGNPAIIVYEAAASTGQGAFIRTYIRLNDGTTWRKALETQIFTTEFIRAGSEDVSISWGGDGIVTNVGRFAVAYTVTSTTVDTGDFVREHSFNVSTGVDNGAALVITWFTSLNWNIACGTRRLWIFKHALTAGNPNWVLGTSVGMAAPFYMGCKMHHNTAISLIRNRSTLSPLQISGAGMAIYTSPNLPNYANVTATFCDNRLQFAFVGIGASGQGTAMRSVVIGWPAVESDTADKLDTISRILDSNYSFGTGSIAVYGGANTAPYAGNFEYTNYVIYGQDGNAVSTTANVNARQGRAESEDTLSPPTVLFPAAAPVSTIIGTNRPNFRFQAQNAALYADVNGIIEFQAATDTGFSVNLRTMVEATTFYRAFSSLNGNIAPIRVITYTPTPAEALFPGTWYVRARLKDDLGGFSAWANGGSLAVGHPPAAVPVAPADNSSILYEAGDITFSWRFTDSEPLDIQSAYQVVIRRLDTNATVLDTGKLTSPNRFHTAAIPSTLRDIPLSWSVSLWDSSNSQGLFSQQLRFTMSDPPVVVITSPASGSTVNTALPTVNWTFTAGSRSQVAYRVYIYNTDTSPATLVGDTGWRFSVQASHTFTSQILANTVNYRVYVEVRDSIGLVASAESNLLGNSGFEGGIGGWTFVNGNQYFETNVLSWFAKGGTSTITRSTAQFHEGVASLLLTPDGTAVTVEAECNAIPAPTGATMQLSAWVRCAVARSVNINFNWFTSAGVYLSTTAGPVVALVANTWTQITATGITSPATAAKGSVAFTLNGTPPATNTLWVDEAVLSSAATTGTITKSTTFKHGGDVSGRLVPPNENAHLESFTYPATAGHAYSASAWLYSVAGWAPGITVTLDWRNSADVTIGTVVFSAALGANAWTKYTATGTAPAGTTGVRAKISMTGSPTTADVLYIDDAVLQHTSTVFFTTWTPPASATLAVTSTDPFKTTITWTNAAIDATFVSWRVYRRYNKKATSDVDSDNTRNTWVLLTEVNVNQANYTYADYTVPLNRSVDYMVAQLVDRFGSLIESNIAGFSTATVAGDRYYFVPEIPVGAIASFEAAFVTADDFTLEVEQATLHVIGRGRQVQVGDDMGYDGTLTIKLRNPATARRDREFMELLSKTDSGSVYIRSPFGDVLFVSFGNVAFTRLAGVGLSDLGDLSVPYSEVFEDVRITRTV